MWSFPTNSRWIVVVVVLRSTPGVVISPELLTSGIIAKAFIRKIDTATRSYLPIHMNVKLNLGENINLLRDLVVDLNKL